jgi:hypothetical protein
MSDALVLSLPPLALPSGNGGTVPGYYYDASLGARVYVDALGDVHFPYRDIYTGLVYQALGFVPREVKDAKTIREDAPIAVDEGTSITVEYVFKYSGPAGSVTVQVGACKKVTWNAWDRSGAVEKTVELAQSDTPRDYPGSITFSYASGGVPGWAPDLFILLHGKEYEIVYTNAFKKLGPEFTELAIKAYQKAT